MKKVAIFIDTFWWAVKDFPPEADAPRCRTSPAFGGINSGLNLIISKLIRIAIDVK